ncbi:HNH endonuclease [Paracoccus jeotgali]|uniref:HNH endonuclease n=1 Tax=Paracoccus jeotgali TaxID=2065379 RepID=A0A2K9MFH8_9RHOB|nr:HNH endonuclease [Paracoccus jeotgali]
MRNCIKDPTKAVHAAADRLRRAIDAHLAGDDKDAARHFRAADSLSVFFWLNPCWFDVEKNVVEIAPVGDSVAVPKADRDPDRTICAQVRREVLGRDGYRCRYCSVRVIPAQVRKRAHLLYPVAVPWVTTDLRRQHAGFAALWLQYDHVVPHSHGGRSDAENVVISCGLCNFGKHNYTLHQLDLSDPRERAPMTIEWDGLTRLLS